MGVVLEFQVHDALNKYLVAKKLPPRASKKFITQIAMGMLYLADKRVIHRDLAGRNVLVHTPDQCKISDFSLAKILGHETEYYRTEQRGLWPIKWYAPECLYSNTFTTYSDVWSFGVTMWEVASSGKTPYPGMKGRQVLEFIEKGNRLKIHPKIIEHEPWMQPVKSIDFLNPSRFLWGFVFWRARVGSARYTVTGVPDATRQRVLATAAVRVAVCSGTKIC